MYVGINSLRSQCVSGGVNQVDFKHRQRISLSKLLHKFCCAWPNKAFVLCLLNLSNCGGICGRTKYRP